MFKAMLQHAFLLMTMRHDGSGMPTKLPGTVIIGTLYFGTNYLVMADRLSLPEITMALIPGPLIFGLFGVQLASASMLITTSMAIITVLVPIAPPMMMAVWQLAAVMSLGHRAAKRKHRESGRNGY